jgi:hypothetical protein
MPCEDYPCCGHGENANGQPDCPDENGQFGCVLCGAKLPITAMSSICHSCQRKQYCNNADGEDIQDD